MRSVQPSFRIKIDGRIQNIPSVRIVLGHHFSNFYIYRIVWCIVNIVSNFLWLATFFKISSIMRALRHETPKFGYGCVHITVTRSNKIHSLSELLISFVDKGILIIALINTRLGLL